MGLSSSYFESEEIFDISVFNKSHVIKLLDLQYLNDEILKNYELFLDDLNCIEKFNINNKFDDNCDLILWRKLLLSVPLMSNYTYSSDSKNYYIESINTNFRKSSSQIIKHLKIKNYNTKNKENDKFNPANYPTLIFSSEQMKIYNKMNIIYGSQF